MRMIKPQRFTGTTTQQPQAYEQPHRQLARRAAAEGIVLLKNEGQILPLPEGSPVALYGAGASKTIKGGTGSGDVNEREYITIYQGMKDGGYQITNEAWIAAYDQCYEEARLCWREDILQKIGKNADNTDNALDFFTAYSTTPFYLPAGPAVGGAKGETAIYVLSRIAGENADRQCIEGDYLLSAEEKQMLADICAAYTNVIVAVNTGGLVDLSFLEQHENIRALLQVMQPGMEGGHAFCDVISGKTVPSGKLTDTWALDYWDYPNSAALAQHKPGEGEGAADCGKITEEFYEEGIYMGYRYFDTFAVPVRYSFGFGLSYTTFAIEQKRVTLISQPESKNLSQPAQKKLPQVAVEVSVTNTGDRYSGREVVQVYVSLPEGRLDKEHRRLCGFAKTKELAPGERQELTIVFSVEQMASYDEELPGWILEEGYYGLWIGNSLSDAALSGMISLDGQAVLTRTEHVCPVQEEMLVEQIPAREAVHARCQQWIKQGKEAALPVIELSAALLPEEWIDYQEKDNSGFADNAAADSLDMQAEQILSRLSTEQMIQLVCGASGAAENSNLGSAGVLVPGSAGETSSCAKEEGVAAITLADGPAGLRLNASYSVKDGKILPLPFGAGFEKGFFCPPVQHTPEETVYYQYCTAIPVGTLLAQTWDEELLEEIGGMIGEEMQLFAVTLWLAPGMNLHRNPLCGRNFEYYSEDPLISGKMAAAITKGVQRKKGCGTTIKHFACNNQENHRMTSNSILSERAFRELYAKGFELAVKEAQPLAIMTSYNLINGIHAANHYDLCTKLARKEWGFSGIIMTDWATTEVDDTCTASGCIRAGNDLIMPGSLRDNKNLRQEWERGTLSEEELKTCVKRILMLILQSDQYE